MIDEAYDPALPALRDPNKYATTNVTNEIVRAMGGKVPLMTIGQVDDRGMAQQPALKFGTATATWTSGNTITVTPCVSQTDNTPTGEPNVVLDITSPSGGAAPTNVTIASGDIITYQLYPDQSGTSKGVVVNVKQGATGTIPAPSAKYEVLQCTSFTSPTVYTVAFGRVRAGP